MNIQTEKNGSEVIMSVDGRIDTTNYNQFESAVNQIFESEVTKITLDCKDLNYISSSGLRIFLIIQKKIISIKGQFKLINMQPAIKEIFDISGFSSIFDIE